MCKIYEYKYEYEYSYEWCLLFYSLRRTSLNDKPLPYVKGLYSVTPYWLSRVTEEVGLSFNRETTRGGLMFSEQFLTRVHYELHTYRYCVA